MDETCKTCRFYLEYLPDTNHGTCHYNPPVINGNISGQFPTVYDHQFCGKWEPRAQKLAVDLQASTACASCHNNPISETAPESRQCVPCNDNSIETAAILEANIPTARTGGKSVKGKN